MAGTGTEHTHGAGSFNPTGATPSLESDVGTELFRPQLWVPSGTQCASSRESGPNVCVAGHDWVVDRELERQGHHFVGYADDVSIYVKSQRSGQRVLDSVSHFVSTHLKLTVSDKVPWRALRSAPSWGIR